jgi:hypothetical protein
MTADQIESRVYKWFAQRYPGNPPAECHEALPVELRAVLFTSVVEGEISNGGLAQLLWNTFHHWRAVLDDAENGYELFSAVENRDAVRAIRRIFEENEQECRDFLPTRDCGKWCGYANPIMEPLERKLESFYFSFTGSGQLSRKAWVLANEKKLHKLLACSPEP